MNFILDVHLGKLARLLRLFGFDVLYSNIYSDEDIVLTALKEERIILTKDRGILKRKAVKHGYYVRSIHPKEQLDEVFTRFNLLKDIQPFIRCLECNGLLIKVNKEEIKTRLPEKVGKYYTEFHRCPSCNRVYWKGSHYEHLNQFIVSFIKKR